MYNVTQSNARFLCDQQILLRIVVCELQVMIGNAEYQCSCVRYVSQDNTALIVGLSVGLGLLLIIIIIIIILIIFLVLCCKR